jgi:hemolysin activation/secretion protein
MQGSLHMFKKLLAVNGLMISIISLGYAADFAPGSALPGSVLPERQSNALSTPPQGNPTALQPAIRTQQEQPQNKMGPEASKITLKLTKIKLVGNHVFPEATIRKIYQDKLNKTISVVDLQGIVQAITNFYRNSGYILSRAILPPQHVVNGVVTIQIIEGYLDKVKVIGMPKGARGIVQRYGNKMAKEQPITVKTMEKYLLIANQVPGVQVKAVLEPSTTNIGASGLDLVTETKPFSGYISYDNYGTRYIGPTETTIGGEADSMFLSGDSTQFTGTETTKPSELKFFQGVYSLPVGDEGARWIFSGNKSLTHPEYTLTPVNIAGDAVTLYAMYQRPLIRSRVQNLTFDASFNYIDSTLILLSYLGR